MFGTGIQLTWQWAQLGQFVLWLSDKDYHKLEDQCPNMLVILAQKGVDEAKAKGLRKRKSK